MRDFFGVSWSCLVRLLVKLDEEVEIFVADGGGFGRRPDTTNGCRRAACGLILRSGSQTRHFAIKSKKSSSLQRNTCCKLLVPGLRRRPFELTTTRGAPLTSKNSFFLVLRLMYSLSGIPSTSMIHDSCSCSFSPGKIGKPVYNSARIHPKLHIQWPCGN